MNHLDQQTRYPVYVISKGRAGRCITSRSLDRMGVAHRVVIEPQEYNDYAAAIDSGKIIVLPFSNLGKGSIPARNWVWDHSISIGAKRHWILDDNIEDFNRLNRNTKHSVRCASTFQAIEDFTDRYENVRISGMNYYSFCKATDPVPPFYLNTRIYSCILLDNGCKHRWRGRFNEDTDLSLRVLKDGDCTLLFNAFLCGKVTSMRMAGGNTNELYEATDNRREFAESLQKQHPDVVRVTKKFGRWHHHVNYKPFKRNKLIRKEGTYYSGVNDYGMTLGPD